MGNQLAAAQTSWYQDQQELQLRIGEFQFLEQLGGGRFLKSFMCIHDEGHLLMKMYTKREPVSLGRVASDLEAMRDKFNRNWPECCNVAAFTRIVETEHGAYLLRQHVHHNLYDRLSQRPFLHMIERKWIAYQLLQALVQSHSCGVCHGDIKTENIVLTAWDWVLLADFAPFKPRSLPDDNPADFSFFFDTPGRQGRPGRRLCYVAPERFTSGDVKALPAPTEVVTPAPGVESLAAQSGFTVPGAPADAIAAAPTTSSSSVRSMGEEWRPSGGELSTAHDVFSLGCVIAELFGKTATPTFSYAEMLRYRKEREAFPLEAKLRQIAEPEVREMVRSMLSLEPTERLSAADYLESRTPIIFPAYFSEFLHQFMAKLLRTSHDEKISIIAASQDEILSTLVKAESEPSESGLIMVANVVTSSLPHLTTPWIKVEALRLLGKFAAHVDDDTRLQRLLPHILSVANDESTVVRAACITAATAVLEPVVEVPAMDTFLFPEYILPAFQTFPDDEDVGVRIAHATCIGSLANAAHTFHRARWDLIAQKNAERSADDHGDAESEGEDDEDDEQEEVEKMRDDFKKNILSVLCDTNPAVRRAGLHGVLRLGTFFGDKLANELLPHIIANLNEGKDWELRAAFFDNITNVAICVGQTAVTEFILPCVAQALTDYEKFVIEKALHALAVLYELALLDTNVMLHVLEKQVTVMVCHPTLPVRAAAVACVLACASQLSMAEVHCKLLPILRPYLKTPDIVIVNEDSLLELLRPPLSKGEWDKIVHSTPQNAEATMRIFDTCAEWVDQKYAPSAADEIKATADEVVANAFRTYDPSGLVELEDREKLVLMRDYIRDFHAKTQTTIALWESENMERMQAGAGNMGGEMTPYFTLSQRISAFRKPEGGPEGVEGLDYPRARGVEVAEGSTHPVTTAKAAAAAAATAAAAAAAPPVTPMRSAVSDMTFGGTMPPPPTPQEPESEEQENVSVAAWPVEKLRMYAVPPAALVTASSSASVVVAGTQIHTVDDYGDPSTPLGGAADLGEEMEDRPSGLLPPSLDTWRPHGALCAHIHEHKAAVNAFSVSADGSYFVSVSDDGTAKMWRNSALTAHTDEPGVDLQDEPSLTQAMYTYTKQSGRILDVCTYGGGGAIATASDAGSIHCIAMVDGGTVRLRRIAPEEGAITKLATIQQSPDLLIYATEGGSLHCVDKRAPTDAWVCDNLAPYGLTTGIVTGSGSEWLAASSSRGFVSIWDTRFHLKVDTWRHPSCSPIYAMTGANPGLLQGRRATRGSSAPCVALATAGAEVSVWDLCGNNLRASLRIGAANASVNSEVIRPPPQRAGGGVYGVDSFASDRELGLRGSEGVAAAGTRSTEHVCGMASASNGQYMLTAGTDSKIRLWDIHTPGASCIVGKPQYRPNVSDGFSSEDRGLRCLSWSDVEEVPNSAGGGGAAGPATSPTQCHHDAITSLEVVSAAGAHPLVLSGGRDGVIKLWH